MDKSDRRIVLEERIRSLLCSSREAASFMIKEEFGGDFEAALANPEFVERMQGSLHELRQKYLSASKALERLEAIEGYPAMAEYAAVIDRIVSYLPSKANCYYPYSGVDFYWARGFNKTVFEDVMFGKNAHHQKSWWGAGTYRKNSVESIISLMKSLGIIPEANGIEIRCSDSDFTVSSSEFNNSDWVLLLKGGSETKPFENGNFQPDYCGIIVSNTHSPFEEIGLRIVTQGYSKAAYFEFGPFMPPYSLEMRNVAVFVKQ